MITMLIAAGLAAVVLAGWWAVRHFGDFGKHAGSGEGALTVAQLLAEAKADELAVMETRELPRVVSAPMAGGFVCDLDAMRQVLAGLQRL